MLVIGIDPGTISTGYGIINQNFGQLKVVSYGVIKAPAKNTLEDKLCCIYKELCHILREFSPSQAALEEPFVSNNVRSALAIGRAQAVAMLAASEMNLPIYRYSPLQVKLQVTNYGASSKIQVNEMVKIQLGIREACIQEDAGDALAVALCHLNQIHLTDFISKADTKGR